jgi:hypothetical protein
MDTLNEQATEHTALPPLWSDDDIDRWITRHALESNDVFDTLRRAMQLVSNDLNAEVVRLTQRVEELQRDLSIADALVDGQVEAIARLDAELARCRFVDIGEGKSIAIGFEDLEEGVPYDEREWSNGDIYTALADEIKDGSVVNLWDATRIMQRMRDDLKWEINRLKQELTALTAGSWQPLEDGKQEVCVGREYFVVQNDGHYLDLRVRDEESSWPITLCSDIRLCHWQSGERAASVPVPDWANAPKWANWWTMDKDGRQQWWEHEPILNNKYSWWLYDWSKHHYRHKRIEYANWRTLKVQRQAAMDAATPGDGSP